MSDVTMKELEADLKQACPAGMSEEAWRRILEKIIVALTSKADQG